MNNYAIIGAGLSGVTVARELRLLGHTCTLFEKSRGRGGRLSTKRLKHWQADHGTQYFTVRDSRFKQEVERWIEQGWVAPWPVQPWLLDKRGPHQSPDDVVRYVGSPTMNAMVHGLADGLDLYLKTRIDRMESINKQWRLWDEHGEQYGLFDGVIITAPLAQTLALVPPNSSFARTLKAAQMTPTWALGLNFDQATGIEADALFVKNGIISWAAKDSSKPGRPQDSETWMLHFSPNWTSNHLEAADGLIVQQAVQLLQQFTPSLLPKPSDWFKHRWLYARAQVGQEVTLPWDSALKIGVAGDWTMGSRLEDAWLSAHRIVAQIHAENGR